MIAICHRLSKFNYPQEAKNIQIGTNPRRGRPRKTTSRLKFQTEIGEEEYVLSDTDNKAEAPKKKPAAKRKTREGEPEPEYDLFENISRTSASLHQASDDEDQMPLHPTTTPAAKKAKTSIFISKSKAKPKTPKKSSKSAANNTQKSKNLQEAVLDSVQANNFTLIYLFLILNFYLVFFLCDNKFSL